jgi:hypothetical protein
MFSVLMIPQDDHSEPRRAAVRLYHLAPDPAGPGVKREKQ